MTQETPKIFDDTVPFNTSPELVEKWADSCVSKMEGLCFDSLNLDRLSSLSFDSMPDEQSRCQFISMTLLADWTSYAPPLYSLADRCAFERMNRVVRSFGEGFRLLLYRLDDGTSVPVGYTGWYPISREIFLQLERQPEKLTDRGLVKPIALDTDIYVYLFNFSVVQPLRHTRASKMLLSALKADLEEYNKKGLACVTVSEDGKRISHRYGMDVSGEMTHMGEAEEVYTISFPVPVRGLKLHPKQKPEPVLLKTGSSKA